MLHAEVASVSDWMRACSTAFVPLRVRSADSRFTARLAQVDLRTGVTLTSVSSRASEVVRDHRVIELNPREDVLLSIHRRGAGMISQHGRTARLTPGGAALYDASSPYTLTFPGQMSEIVLQLPRSSVSSVGSAFEDLTARVLPMGGALRALTVLAGAVTPTAQRKVATGTNPPADTVDVAESLASLLRACLAESALESAPPLEADLLAVALHLHVDEHADDPQLTPSALAGTFHISLRHLQKLFATYGDDTPAAYIRTRRVEIAQRLLRDGATVSQAAYRSGFRDVDTFSRAFRRECGVRPSRLVREGV